jgi:translation initiation factor IF-1
MVRNLKGGTGTKALGRKYQNSGGHSEHVRIPSCAAEQFACVTKLFGHGMCEVFTNNNVRLIGHIRNKFRGKQKRQNTITSSMIVLVGLREWESSPTNCDILCIYDDRELELIQNMPGISIEHVIRLKISNSYSNLSNLPNDSLFADLSNHLNNDFITSNHINNPFNIIQHDFDLNDI